MKQILTIDLGTTYFKLCLFDDSGRLLVVRRASPPIRCIDGVRYELDADGFYQTLVRAIGELGGGLPNGLSGVEAVCFATQANSFLLLDKRDEPLTPIILWPDDRACPADPVILQLARGPDFYRETGIAELSGQFLVAKLHWLKLHEPAAFSGARRVCLISDYLTLWMTGRHVTEAGMAGLSGMVDIHALRWRSEPCGVLGIPMDRLPRVVRAGTDLGVIKPEIATLLGLPEGCRYIVGCLDQYAGAIGAGNVHPGGVSETTGTVLASVRCSDRFSPDMPAGVFQGPGHDAGTWYQMVFGNTSANLLEAYRNNLPDRPDYDVLSAPAADAPPGADGIRLNPGDRSGTDRMFLNLTQQHTAGLKVRAILEGVARALDEQLNTLTGDVRPAYIRSAGGAARSPLWLQIKSDVIGLPVQATECTEPTSLGAAILAASSLGGVPPAVIADRWVRVRAEHQPDISNHRFYHHA